MTENNQFIYFLALFICFLTVIILSNFFKYYIYKDYSVYSYTNCDPSINSCFVTDPDFSGFTFYTNPYAKVEMMAYNAPKCLDEHTCEGFACDNEDVFCTITYCSTETLESGEICVNESI